MIRLIGVLTGAALAIGLLLLVLGTPKLVREPPDDKPDTPVVAAPQAPRQPETPREPELPREAVAQSAPIHEAEPVAEAEPMAEAEPIAEPEPAPEAAAPADPRPEPVAANTNVENEVAAQNWYAFWSPFRSRIAADGFVSELSRTTGLDYRVVKLKPGVFEVAVAYTDDADIEDKLTRISAATGLDMSGG